MRDHLIGSQRKAQALPRVPWLAAWLFLAWLTQAPGLPPTTICRRRLVTGVAVFCEPLLQRPGLIRQVLHLVRQLADSLIQQAVFRDRHAELLTAPASGHAPVVGL